LYIFNTNHDSSILFGQKLSSISRQLSLSFNIVNQSQTVRRGEECWKIIMVYACHNTASMVN
jgi:hypothetical protein